MMETPETPQPQETPKQDYFADAERRKEAERKLVSLGVSSEEIRRLLNADAFTTEVPDEELKPKPLEAVISAPPLPAKAPKKGKNNRVTAESLQMFAAQLIAEKSETQNRAVEERMAELPEFRPSTPQERLAGEGLLREANLLRRQEKYAEAEEKCRKALELVPKDAPGLEMLGDILQGVGRVDEALAAYRRATLADPKRITVERKYADLMVRQQNWDRPDPESVTKNPWVATLLSALLPSAGQIYNGQNIKALGVAGGILLSYVSWEMFRSHNPTPNRIDWGAMIPFLIGVVIYLYGITDASYQARKGQGTV